MWPSLAQLTLNSCCLLPRHACEPVLGWPRWAWQGLAGPGGAIELGGAWKGHGAWRSLVGSCRAMEPGGAWRGLVGPWSLVGPGGDWQGHGTRQGLACPPRWWWPGGDSATSPSQLPVEKQPRASPTSWQTKETSCLCSSSCVAKF